MPLLVKTPQDNWEHSPLRVNYQNFLFFLLLQFSQLGFCSPNTWSIPLHSDLLSTFPLAFLKTDRAFVPTVTLIFLKISSNNK